MLIVRNAIDFDQQETLMRYSEQVIGQATALFARFSSRVTIQKALLSCWVPQIFSGCQL
jgi:hypothetical protein